MADAATHILVTGGAGFIGSHLCDALLAAGHRVSVLDDLSTGRRHNLDPRVALHVGSITDPAAVRAAASGVDGIVHLAAIASVARGNEDWPGTHAVNQSGTIFVLDAARRASAAGGPVPVVYASSAAVYGDASDVVATEALAPAPRTAYGADKLGSELHAAVATGVHGVPTLGFRFFNVYGPRQDPNSPYSGVISIFARRIACGEPVLLHGDGNQTRDFVHVSDVVAHLVAGMAGLRAGHAMPGVLNVCTGVSVTIRDLAERLAAIRHVALDARSGPPRAGDIRQSRGCPALARRTLGVAATVPLHEGLASVFG